LSLSSRYFWQSLYKDAYDYVHTCSVCLRSKPSFGQRVQPLYPLSVASQPFTEVALDHKILSRKTQSGNTAILCLVDCFSGWCSFVALPDVSALSSARAFVEHWVTIYGMPQKVHTYRGSAFTSTFFTKVCSLLAIKHRTSASLMARINGMAESAVKKLSTLLRVYSTDDITIEDQLPLIAMCIRATPQIDLQLSPYEINFGRPMPINAPGETSLATQFGDTQESWFCHLCRELRRLHDAVKNRKEEIKLEQKNCL